MPTPRRFRRDGLVCSACGSPEFKYKEDPGKFRLQIRSSAWIMVDAGEGRYPDLTRDVTCARCGVEYAAQSGRDPE